jgi:branched-chain amino acid transport system ATP-binding protein
LLEVRDLDVFYGDLQALRQISLRVDAREVVALLGPNGAGKTTLLRTIAGLQRPASGEVTFKGISLHREPAHRIVAWGVSLVPEGRRLFAGMTVLENLELGAFTPDARRQRAQTLRRVYEMFPVLAERRHQLAGTMSGGEQQMLAICRALMAVPKLLLLDEPSLGLAPLVVRHIFEVIRHITADLEVSVLLVDQNVKAALELAGRAYLVQSGRMVGCGTGQDLLKDEQVRTVYLGLPSGSG